MKRFLGQVILAVIIFAALLRLGHAAIGTFWASATGFQSTGVTFSQLTVAYSTTNQTGVPQNNGTQVYCSDCTVGASNLCVGGGTGAYAQMVNGVWLCGLNAGAVGQVNAVNGILLPTAFGAKCDGATDDTTAIQATLSAGANTGTGGTSKMVMFPPGLKCNFSSTLDFKGVPTFCAGATPFGSGTKSTTILNFTGTSGAAIIHAGKFYGCEVDGGFTVGSGLNSTISAISESGNTVTVTTSAVNTLVQGAGFVISGTTNYNGPWRVRSVTDSSHFTFQDGNSGLGSEVSGTVNYYPTVGVQHMSESGTVSCCDVDWQNLVIVGFGVGMDISANQSGVTGSTDDWKIGNSTIRAAIIGIQALGDGLPISGSPLVNVAGGAITGPVVMSQVAIGVNCGPPNSDQETGCGKNKWQHIDWEAPDSHSSDSPIVGAVIANSYANEISSNYLSGAAGAGQTMNAVVDTTGGWGGNSVHDNFLGGAIGSQWKGVGADTAYNNSYGGTTAQQMQGTQFSGGIAPQKIGTTSAPASVVTVGATGGAAVQYALVCHDWGYSGNGVSDGTALASSFVSTGGAGSGPAAFSGSNFARICWKPDPRCKSYDILVGDTSHVVSGGLNYSPGGNGNNCFPDTAGTSAGYTPPGSDTTGSARFGTPMDVSNWSGIALLNQGGTGTAGQYVLTSTAGVLGLLSYANEVLFDAPGGYWKFNEASGNFSDSSGNSNTATAVGGISYSVTGAIVDGDTAITLNGSTGAATVATAASLPSGDTFTVEGWLKRADTGVSEMLVGQKASGFEVYLNTANNLVLRQSGVADILRSTSTITDTAWHQFAATKNGTNAHVYIDGVDVSFAIVNETIAPADASLYIGKNNGASQFFNGSLDDIAVYKTALTPDRIAAHYLEASSKKNGRIGYATDVKCSARYVGGQWQMEDCGQTTVAALPDCTKVKGAWATVTDNNAACGVTGFWVSPTGGGSNVCHVNCDGSNATTGWKVN